MFIIGFTFCFCLSFVLSTDTKMASVKFDAITGRFRIYDNKVENSVAYGTFKNEISLTGWSYLEIETDEKFSDPIQAYAAGVVEGYLTADLIRDHWYNIASDYCKNEEVYCQKLSSFIQDNLNFIDVNVNKRESNAYWHQVALTLEQLHGLEDGFNNMTTQPSTSVNAMGLMLMNLMGDLMDLERVLGKNETQYDILRRGSCSAIVKVLPNNTDIYFSHNSWTNYNFMLRILKKHSLKFHRTMGKDAPLIPGHTATFSSQPGFLFSLDDFYLLSSGLAVMETTITNENPSLWKFVTSKGIIFDWQRNLIANRLARSGRQWTELFRILNSGTYNNQFMILDYKLFHPGGPLPNNLLHVLEQLPGNIYSADVTEVLRQQNYWPSYNVAYFKDIFTISGAPYMVEKYGDYFSYERCPRALIFRRDHNTVVDMDSLVTLMRYNNFTTDPLSKCKCEPPHNAHLAIAARNDLNPADGVYPLPSLGHGPHGAIDLKATNSELFERQEFLAVAGPTYDSQPPFQWSLADFDKDVKHRGHPDLWRFKPVHHKWNRL